MDAHAKVNFTLEVMGKRPDGYHQVRMLMVGLDLADKLSFKARRDSRLVLDCDDKRLSTGKGNLVIRAAERLRQATGCDKGASIELTKHIPLAAGLAGGSSDAAATLVGLNRLWGLKLGEDELLHLAASVGSDVPFCLRSGWAIATGRGEQIQPQTMRKAWWVVLANPGFEVSTKWAYQNVDFPSDGRKNYSKLALNAFKEKKLEAIRNYCMNDLETATEKKIPGNFGAETGHAPKWGDYKPNVRQRAHRVGTFFNPGSC